MFYNLQAGGYYIGNIAGSKLSKETRLKIGESNRKYYINHPEARERISKKFSGEKNPMYGISLKNSGMSGKHHTEESKAKISKNHADVSGEKNPSYGKKVVNNGTSCKRILPEELDKYLNNGWKLGMIPWK